MTVARPATPTRTLTRCLTRGHPVATAGLGRSGVGPQRCPHPVIPTDHPTEGRPPVSRMIEARNPIGELVTGRQWDQLRDALRPLHPSDIADVIIEQPTQTKGIIFRLLPREKAAREFAYLPTADQRRL